MSVPLPETSSESLSSNVSSVSSGSSYAQSKSKSQSSESLKEDSVHSSDEHKSSEPEDGIPLSKLGENEHLSKFEEDQQLVLYDMLRAAVNQFYLSTHLGFTGAAWEDDALKYTGIKEQPEGIWPRPDDLYQNPELVKAGCEFMEDVAELCFVSDVGADRKKKKKDPTSIRTLYNTKQATEHRKELAEKRRKAAREAELAKKRKHD